MQINIKNIEELIFYDRKLQKFFPEFQHFFNQWQLGQNIPALKTLAKRSVVELLNSLEEKHLKILEDYFQEKIFISKLDNNIIANYQSILEEEHELCKFVNFQDFCVTRNKDNFKVTFWR